MAKVWQQETVKEAVAARLWLHYYNRTLYEHGVICEQERNRMALKIDGRTGACRKDGR